MAHLPAGGRAGRVGRCCRSSSASLVEDVSSLSGTTDIGPDAHGLLLDTDDGRQDGGESAVDAVHGGGGVDGGGYPHRRSLVGDAPVADGEFPFVEQGGATRVPRQLDHDL